MLQINALDASESDGMCIGGNQAFCITYAINFKIMTTSNSDYPSEILDQELSFTELENLSGGKGFSYSHESLVVTIKGKKIVLKNRSEFKGDKEYEKYFKERIKEFA